MATSQKVMAYAKLAQKWSKQTGVLPQAILAIIHMESGGNAEATRYEPGYEKQYSATAKFRAIQSEAKLTVRAVATSYGLMQLMLPTAWGYLSIKDKAAPIKTLFTPDKNIRYGSAHFATILKSKLKYYEAFKAYNGGGEKAERYAANCEALMKEYAAVLADKDMTERVGPIVAAAIRESTPKK